MDVRTPQCVCVCVSLPSVKSAAFEYCLVIHKSVALSDESVTHSCLLTSTKVIAYKCKRTCLPVQKFKAAVASAGPVKNAGGEL